MLNYQKLLPYGKIAQFWSKIEEKHIQYVLTKLLYNCIITT